MTQLDEIVEAIRDSQRPSGVATVVVAIDGLSGAGNSSLARRLADKLCGQIVTTDDFASWETPFDWEEQFLEAVLNPLACGETARYQPRSWAGETKQPAVVAPGGVVIVEGVGSSRTPFRPFLAYTIWVHTPQELRLQRGLDRDGEEARGLWEKWMLAEDA